MKINVLCEVMRVTPETATEWLADRWGEQRPLREKHVNRLCSDMIHGNFKLGPDAILRVKGKLANGQHRLTALVRVGKAQTFIVMESNDEELYKIVDAGLKRTAADSLISLPYATKLPPIAKWVQTYEAGMLSHGAREGGALPGDTAMTQLDIINYCSEHSELLSEAAQFCADLYNQSRLLPLSIGASLYVIAAKSGKHLEKTKEFLVKVYVNGGGDAAGDFRNRLTANRSGRARLAPGYIFGIGVKALKSYLQGTRPGVLRWVDKEDLPVI